MIGSELTMRPGVSPVEATYIKLFGAPINGLRIRARHIMPLFDKISPKPAKILDAGCGKGVFSFALARKFPNSEITGLDIEQEILDKNEVVKEKGNYDNVSFIQSDLIEHPFNEEFDCVVSIDNMEHIEDHLAGAKALYRALKPGGHLVLHVPGRYRRWPLFSWKDNFYVPGHFRHGYTTDDITNVLEKAGFTIENCRYTYGLLENWTNNLSYKITAAQEKNKAIYALVFPILLGVSWLGKFARPKMGAGVRVFAKKA